MIKTMFKPSFEIVFKSIPSSIQGTTAVLIS